MSERWFEDIPDHDPDDPEAVERALRRQERTQRRQGGEKPATGRKRAAGKDRPPKAPKGGRGGRRTGGRRTGRLVAVALFAVVVVAVGWFLMSLYQPFAGEGEGDPFVVDVPRGASVSEIGDLLAEEGVISSATFFQLRATISGKDSELNHGRHTFRRDMSYAAALEELSRQTASETTSFVIQEGLSRSEAAEVVSEAGIPGDYMEASARARGFNPNRYGAQGRADSLEGFLFPATYELRPGSDARRLVNQQLKAFTDNVATVDMRRARRANLNVYDVLIIASMVEREVSVPEERRMVAAVIHNRLRMGEPLGIDATIRYAVDNWQEPLRESELATDSPYNTRLNAGLPPGPIGSPGLASIGAAANPADTDALFYVVKPGTCGEHVFASTLEEHNRNVAEYERAREEAGGSPTTC